MIYTYNANHGNRIDTPAGHDGVEYIPTEEAYYHQDSYQASGYKIVRKAAADCYEVETDDGGEPVEYMLYFSDNSDYDPDVDNEDSACDWYELSNVERIG